MFKTVKPILHVFVTFISALSCVLFSMLSPTPPSHKAYARTGAYTLALIRVLYSDQPTTRSSMSQLNQAVPEIQTYFSQLSYNNLSVTVRTVEVSMTNTSGFYWVNCRANANDMRPCSRFHQDVVDAAIATGFDFSDIDGIVYVSACGIRNDVTEPGRIRIRGRDYTVSYDYDCGDTGTGQTPGAADVWWNGWAHEIGHQLQVADNTNLSGWLGHPSGYASGYDLMDSGYPNHESAYGLSGAPVNNGAQRVFPNWLPTAKVVTIAGPATGSTGQTVVLAPLSQHPDTTTAAQALKVPLSAGRYYMVEARRRLNSDNYNVGPGIYDEGVHIIEVIESRNPPVRNIDTCETLVSPGGCIRDMNTDPRASSCNTGARTAAGRPNYCWPYPLWHVGESYYNASDQVEIRVVSESGNGYAITVVRGVPPGHPDVYLTPWLTPPMNTYETTDIWVDSSCNGYEDAVGAVGLRYGRRSDGTVVGNGDTPCANHDNRIYARVRNGGDRPADNVRVRFLVTDPLGVGVRGDTGWTVAGVAESGVFTTLASIPAGGYADVYVNWTPVVSPSVALGRQFNYHSCIQIQIDPVAGEVVTSNQDGVGEQENIDVFELVRDFSTSLYAPTEGQFFVRNPAGKKTEFPFGPRRFRLHIDSQLPAGWTYEVGDGSDELTLDVDETRWIPVKITVPNDTPIGKSFDLKVDASTDYILQNDAMPESGFGVVPQVHHHLAPVSGLVLNAHTVIGSKLKLNAQATAGGWIYVSGQLDPQTQGILTLDFMNPQGTTYSQQVVTEKDGHFATTFIPPAKKQYRRVARQLDEQWSIRGIYQGNLTQSSTASELSIVTVTGAPQMYTLHLPVAIR